MKSETAIQKRLEELESDLIYWRDMFNKTRDESLRRIRGNTIIGVESEIECLKWVLKGS